MLARRFQLRGEPSACSSFFVFGLFLLVCGVAELMKGTISGLAGVYKEFLQQRVQRNAYIRIYTDTYVYIYIYIYICGCVRVCMYMHIKVYECMYVCLYTYTYAYVCSLWRHSKFECCARLAVNSKGTMQGQAVL